jgi:succinoglycan biosynthesis transport protein ExoP
VIVILYNSPHLNVIANTFRKHGQWMALWWLYALLLITINAIHPFPWSVLMPAAGAAALIGTVFLVREIRARRVYDPLALSKRLQSQVYTLPMMPRAEAIRQSGEGGARRCIQRFIHKVDHLRYAYCRNDADPGRSPCLLVTSAVEAEGKTTLAAQLAVRSGNAGTTTLLIEADVWKPDLAPLLDLPEGPGLTELLNDEATLDEVAMPYEGGPIYLIRAGTQLPDMVQLLQGKRLESLIESLRWLYDLIIFDSPPVLARPDALILCRQVDTVILTARRGYSRYPLVARAKLMLAATGVASIGVVLMAYDEYELG